MENVAEKLQSLCPTGQNYILNSLLETYVSLKRK